MWMCCKASVEYMVNVGKGEEVRSIRYFKTDSLCAGIMAQDINTVVRFEEKSAAR